MTPDEFQAKCLRTVRSEPGRETLLLCATGIAGEAGEVIEPIKKHAFHGRDLDTADLAKEIGDVLWYLAVLAHAVGWRLSDVMTENVRKLEARHLGGGR